MTDPYDPLPDLAAMLAAGVNWRGMEACTSALRIAERLGTGEDDTPAAVEARLREAHAAVLLDALRAVLEALDIPNPATLGDEEAHSRALKDRVRHTVVMLRSVLGPERSAGVPWSTAYLRERLAEHPPTGYKTWQQLVAGTHARAAGARPLTAEAAAAVLTGHGLARARTAGGTVYVAGWSARDEADGTVTVMRLDSGPEETRHLALQRYARALEAAGWTVGYSDDGDWLTVTAPGTGQSRG